MFALPLERVSYLHGLHSRLQKNLRRVRAYIGIYKCVEKSIVSREKGQLSFPSVEKVL